MKNNNYIKYIIILILVCFVVMGNTGVMSRFILSNVRNEVIPLAETNEVQRKEFLEEIIPANGVNENITNVDYVEDINHDSASEVDTQIFSETTTSEMVTTASTTETTEFSDVVEDDSNVSDELTSPAVSINQASQITDIGINYSMEQLGNFEFLMGNCYTVDGSTSITSEDINIETMLNEDLSLDLTGDEYKVLIYHTHGSESFIDSRPGVTEDTIIGVGDELTRILQEDYGIKTYHDRTVYDVIDGKLDRNDAYTESGKGIDSILQQYPSIEVVLDIHRDGVRDDVHLMKVIDGKPTAQIMFFNGISRLNEEGDLEYLYNPNRSSNLSFSLQMHLKGKALYGDLMRKIYVGGYCYNLDRKPRASLIEVGAQTNTVEEAKNAMIPLAAILYSVLSGN